MRSTSTIRRHRHNKSGQSAKHHVYRPALEALEDRAVPTAYVFVDFGDNFPVSGANRVLTTNVGAIRDVAGAQFDNQNNLIPSTVIPGPQLTDVNDNNYPDATAVNFTRFNFTANQRAQMMAVARRALAAVDVTVVELTATAQTLADGRSVAGAANLVGVSATLRGNNTTSRDVYIIAATPGINPTAANPNGDNPNVFATNGYGGMAPTGTVLGDVTDLQSSFNNHDDLVLAFTTSNLNFVANTIVHEAGHALGLQHAVTTAVPAGSAINNAIHTSEVMSYLSDGDFFFSRFPMVRGNDNTDPQVFTLPLLPPIIIQPPWNNFDLAARQGQRTPFDQLRVDPKVGENPNLHYISGTGAHDIITVTRGFGDTAHVSVQAFTDNTYTTAIIVPGTTDTTYRYTVNLDRRLLIQDGLGDDRIILDGALNARVDVDGMFGADEVIVNDQESFALLGTTYTVTATEVTRERRDIFGGAWLTVGYDAGIEALTINTGSSSSGAVVNVNSLAATPVTVNLSSFLNVVTVGQAAVSVDGQLTVNGGAGLDLLTINDQALLNALPATYSVTSTEVTRERFVLVGLFLSRLTVSYAGIDDLTLNAGGSVTGSNVNVNSLSATPLTINLGSVVNVVTVGQSAVSVDGRLTVNGSAGLDVLAINDQALLPATPATYTVTATEVTRERFVLAGLFLSRLTVSYAGIDNLTLNAGGSVSGSNVNVNSLSAAPVTVNLGSVVNVVTVGQAAVSVDGQLTVNGGAGLDLLTINDQALLPATPANYTVTATEVTRERFVLVGPFLSRLTVGYAGIDDLTLNAGGSVSGSNVNVQSVAAATPVTLNLGSVVNLVTVGDSANSMDLIAGALTLHGSGSHDALTLNDQGNGVSQVYTVTADRVARTISPGGTPPSVSITYDAIESLALNTGSGGSIVHVDSTTAGTSTTVAGHANALDIFTVGFGADTNRILGPVTFAGQAANNDFAYYYEFLNPNPQTYTVQSILPSLLTVSRSGIAPVSYQGLAGVSFLAPAVGGSYLNVQSTPTGTQLGVAAGSGDRIMLGSNAPNFLGMVGGIQGHVFVGPGVANGSATLIVDDSGNATTARNVSISRFESLGTVYGLTPGGITFLDHDNWVVDLRGGALGDRFLMNGPAFGTQMAIDGGGGVNTLDYSAHTGGVVVNLPLQTATGLRGGITNIQNVVGSAGNDILVGNAAANALRGGAGRDLLIGGLGADLIDGGADDNLLIGGWTNHDTNAAALDAILAAWAQPLPYQQRIENLMDNGVAYPGGRAFLDKDRVHDDLAADNLTGGLGRDWFFRDPLRTGLDAILDLVESGRDKERVTVTRN